MAFRLGLLDGVTRQVDELAKQRDQALDLCELLQKQLEQARADLQVAECFAECFFLMVAKEDA